MVRGEMSGTDLWKGQGGAPHHPGEMLVMFSLDGHGPLATCLQSLQQKNLVLDVADSLQESGASLV